MARLTTYFGWQGLELALPDLQLTDIGDSPDDSGGVSGAEAAGAIINAIISATGKAVSQSGAVRELADPGRSG